jgi:hypothetical protein
MADTATKVNNTNHPRAPSTLPDGLERQLVELEVCKTLLLI